MNKIVFECMNQNGEAFTVSMSSANPAIRNLVADTVAAYRVQGVEVISASQVEELAVDLNLHVRSRKARAVAKPSAFMAYLPSFNIRPGYVIGKVVAACGLMLSVVGFDDGFSLAHILAHAERLWPALSSLV